MSDYAFKKVQDIFEDLNSSAEGLSTESVLMNRQKFGKNFVEDKKHKSRLKLFLSQFNNLFNYILVTAATIVFLLGDFVDFYVIVAVIFINAFIGFFQEGKAQKVFEVLQNSVKSEAVVFRNGERQKIIDEEVVAGDIVFLKDGDKVPADSRILEANNLKMDESSLTGETATVLKNTDNPKDNNAQVSDQENMVFKGTHVVSGLAKVVVVSVGSDTEIGKVAGRISELETELPIKKTIKNLSKLILMFVVLFSLITFIFGLGYGIQGEEIFSIVVALFISAIPESLPVILTLVLAAGFHRMGKKNVLVKKLQAVDALGQTNIVALDKTGTITRNQMKVEKIYADGKFFYVSGDGYEPRGKIIQGENNIDLYEEQTLQLLTKIAVSTSIGDFSHNEKDDQWELNYGDPTEVALLVLGEKIGVNKDELLKKYPIEREIPFDMHYKHHSTINTVGEERFLYVAGAPEVVLDSTSHVLINGEEIELDTNQLEKIMCDLGTVTKEGYRTLCMAYQKNPDKNLDPNDLSSLVFVGFVGINDTIRNTVESSIADLENAGMKAVMITGDHRETAIGIAKKVGIFKKGDIALTGKEMRSMNDVELGHEIENVSVFARVTPEQKLKIISLYKNKGLSVAMTGDGVNDVLSLVKADIGVSMGYGATDVAKEASDIILLDNNFGSLATGVLEGRNIYINIKKTVEYLLSTNIAELFVVMISVIAGLPVALTAVQILWLNLVTDSFLAAGFAFEPIDKKLSTIKKWKPSKYLVDRNSIFKILYLAIVMTLISLVFFVGNLDKGIVYAHTMVLSTLTVLQIFNVLAIKADNKSIFKVSMFNNKYLLGGIFISAFMFLFAMYNPFLQGILEIQPINSIDWLYVLGFGLVLIVVEELRKLFIK
jgi:Ca2+-transporting ATPase